MFYLRIGFAIHEGAYFELFLHGLLLCDRIILRFPQPKDLLINVKDRYSQDRLLTFDVFGVPATLHLTPRPAYLLRNRVHTCND